VDLEAIEGSTRAARAPRRRSGAGSSARRAGTFPSALPCLRRQLQNKLDEGKAVFTREPWIRTPEQVVASLFRIGTNTGANPSPPPRPEHKRVWASLLKGKEAVINEVALEVQRRDPGGCKTLVALTVGPLQHQLQPLRRPTGLHSPRRCPQLLFVGYRRPFRGQFFDRESDTGTTASASAGTLQGQ